MPASLFRAPALRAFAIYTAVTIALTYPLIVKMTTGVPNDPGDSLLVSWILWWNAHTIPFSHAFWNAPAFYPAEGVTAFSEHFAGLAVISTPLYWLTGNIQLGYNVAMLLSFLLSAFFAYLLCRELTGREDAAFVGGLIFGFTPYRIDQLPHMQMLMSCWMPLGLFGLHRYVRTERARWLVLFGLAWLMQGLASGYLMMFFAVLVAGWCVWFLPWRRWRIWTMAGGAWVLAMAPLVPVLLTYRRIHEFYGFHRGIDEIQSFSADMTGVVQPPTNLLAWHWLTVFPHAEGAIFPGITGAMLITLALLVKRTPAQSPAWLRRLHVALGLLTVWFAVKATAAAFFPWHASFLGISLSNTRYDGSMIYAALALLGWVATHPRAIGAFRRRSPFAFYVSAAAVLWMFCLGPVPEFLGHSTPYTGPYTLLLHLPGFDGLRVPARFAMSMILCIACGGAIAFGRVVSAWTGARRLIMTAVVVCLALADGWPRRFVVLDRPEPWPIQSLETSDPLIELPISDDHRNTDAMYRSIYTPHPVVNGYSGNGPTWYGPLATALDRRDTELLEELAGMGVRQVVLDTSLDVDRPWQQYFETRGDITLVGTEGTHRLYRLPPVAPPPADPVLGPSVPLINVAVSVNARQIPALTDGNLETRWETGPQKGTEQLTVDIGPARPLRAAVLTMGGYSSDAPRRLLVETSADGHDWTEVWRGAGARLVFRAVVRDPRRTAVAIDLGDRTARYIRFSQLGEDPIWYWSIAELGIYAPPAR